MAAAHLEARRCPAAAVDGGRGPRHARLAVDCICIWFIVVKPHFDVSSPGPLLPPSASAHCSELSTAAESPPGRPAAGGQEGSAPPPGLCARRPTLPPAEGALWLRAAGLQGALHCLLAVWGLLGFWSFGGEGGVFGRVKWGGGEPDLRTLPGLTALGAHVRAWVLLVVVRGRTYAPCSVVVLLGEGVRECACACAWGGGLAS